MVLGCLVLVVIPIKLVQTAGNTLTSIGSILADIGATMYDNFDVKQKWIPKIIKWSAQNDKES